MKDTQKKAATKFKGRIKTFAHRRRLYIINGRLKKNLIFEIMKTYKIVLLTKSGLKRKPIKTFKV
jgi:hypothetical protein